MHLTVIIKIFHFPVMRFLLFTMKIFIITKKNIELKGLHDPNRDQRVCDGIKAVLLAFEDLCSVMTAEALRLQQIMADHAPMKSLIKVNSRLKEVVVIGVSSLNRDSTLATKKPVVYYKKAVPMLNGRDLTQQ
ncbi:hypothetical protein C9426_29470 [Serratia sp. S1B]|nr:hypothetical protein C9426_29470 [Serratia sp. S1B]